MWCEAVQRGQTPEREQHRELSVDELLSRVQPLSSYEDGDRRSDRRGGRGLPRRRQVVSLARPRGRIVIDTDVFSAELDSGSRVTVRLSADHRRSSRVHLVPDRDRDPYGALFRGWGEARLRAVESRLARVEIVRSGPELVISTLSCGPTVARRSPLAQRGITPTAGSPRWRFVSASRPRPRARARRRATAIGLPAVVDRAGAAISFAAARSPASGSAGDSLIAEALASERPSRG